MKHIIIKTFAFLSIVVLPVTLSATSLKSLSDDITHKVITSLLVQIPNKLTKQATNHGIRNIRKNFLGNDFPYQCRLVKSQPYTTITIVEFYHYNQTIASAVYAFDHNNNTIDLRALELDTCCRNLGFGGAFFKLSMAEIAKDAQKQKKTFTKVTWYAHPVNRPKNLKMNDAKKSLYKFYRAQGATVDETSGDSYLDLVQAGYLKGISHEK